MDLVKIDSNKEIIEKLKLGKEYMIYLNKMKI
jgi:hypothetical protein